MVWLWWPEPPCSLVGSRMLNSSWSMSLPRRTLAMYSKTEDLPTPVSPTRRIVHGAFSLIIPIFRDSMSLYTRSEQNCCVTDVVETHFIIEMLPPSSALSSSASGLTVLRDPAELLIDVWERTWSLEESLPSQHCYPWFRVPSKDSRLYGPVLYCGGLCLDEHCLDNARGSTTDS